MKVLKSLFPFVAIAAAVMLVAGVQGNQNASKAKIGEAAPDFTLTDTDGKTVSLSDHAGKIVVLEWFNPDCPYVQRWYNDGGMNKVYDKYKDKDVVWLAINTTAGHSVDADKKAMERWKIARPVLNDADGKVGRAYGARTTPHMYIIDKEGRLAYMGGIDDDERGNKGDKAVNYVAKALDELLAGESVSTPESRPYGCSVKYQ